jgi:hypothetical protein
LLERNLRVFRVVLDNNQNLPLIDKLHASASFELVIPAYVFAEAVLGPAAKERLKRLRRFRNRTIGLPPAEVFDRISQVNRSEIVDFEPFDADLGLPQKITADWRNWAQQIKDVNLAFCARIKHVIPTLRAAVRKEERLSQKKIRFNSLDDFIREISETAKHIVASSVTNGGTRHFEACDESSLFDVLMQNPYIALFFRAQFYFICSFMNLWEPYLNRNFEPRDKNDFFTDWTLSLAIENDSIVLTEDAKVKEILSVLSPKTRLMNVGELVKYLNHS